MNSPALSHPSERDQGTGVNGGSCLLVSEHRWMAHTGSGLLSRSSDLPRREQKQACHSRGSLAAPAFNKPVKGLRRLRRGRHPITAIQIQPIDVSMRTFSGRWIAISWSLCPSPWLYRFLGAGQDQRSSPHSQQTRGCAQCLY